MALSLFQNIFKQMLKRFTANMGRGPVSPFEWNEIQSATVRHLNKTKGVPKGKTEDPFSGWKPEIVEQEVKNAEIIDFPKKGGITELIEKGDIMVGKAPKTQKSTLDAKKGVLDKQINKEEWIARKKQENKEAIDRFRKKMEEPDPDDPGHYEDGMAEGGIAPLIGEPSYAANFYDDRTPMAGGGAIKKFIERLFIKASNDIRQGKGKWKGLKMDQRITQHDNLTKKVTEFQKTGKLPEGTEEYFDVNVEEAFGAAQKSVEKAALPRVHTLDERTMLKQKYPGIADDLIEQIKTWLMIIHKEKRKYWQRWINI